MIISIITFPIMLQLVSGEAFQSCKNHADCMLGENCWRGQCQCTAHSENEHFGCTQPGYGCKHYEDRPNECLPSPTLRPNQDHTCNLAFPNECLSNDCRFLSFPMNGKCECNFRSDCDLVSFCDRASKTKECNSLINVLYTRQSNASSEIYAPYYLLRGWALESRDGQYYATIQYDFNFVIYDRHRRVIFATMSNNWAARRGDGFSGMMMSEDGNFKLIDAVNNTAWSTNTAGCGRYVMLQNDGNLVVYGEKEKVCWMSTYRSIIGLNRRLNKGHRISSPNNHNHAVFQHDGNFVVYGHNSQILFESNTRDIGEYAWFQEDGNFVVYDYFNKPVWASNTDGMNVTHAYMYDDGNFLIMTKHYLPKWAARGMLFMGQRLEKGQELKSLNSKNAAVMQPDGNFVVYANNREVKFATDTMGQGEYVVMETNGNFALYDKKNRVIWSTGTYDRGHHLVMQDDGNLVLCNEQLAPIWTSSLIIN